MASISSLSASTNSAMSSLRGYGGLASGLDRDELIQGMTSGTQTKITKQEQAKTKLEWQQQAYRDISDKMISFANKYTATMSSSTNLFSDAFWGAASTSVIGKNSKFISVAGANKTAAANVSILGVKQLAQNAKMMSSSAVSDRKLTTGVIESKEMEISTLAGKSLQFSVGGNSYSVSLPYGTGKPFASAQEAADAFNEAMKKVEVSQSGSSKKTLFDSVEIGVTKDGDGNDVFTIKQKTTDAVSLKGGSALEAMGFKEQVDAMKKNGRVGLDIPSGEGIQAGLAAKLSETQTLAQRLGGKGLTFNYNGTSKNIDLPSAEDIAKNAKDGDGGLKYVEEELQKGLDAAFGKDRIEVKLEDDGRLTFRTTVPDNKKGENEKLDDDTSSTLSITGGSQSLMASHGGLGIAEGESNRLNLNTGIKNSGLNGASAMADDKTYKMKINDVEFEFTAKDSINSIMDKINKSGAGVKISYLSMADKFVMESTVDGASGSIKIEGSGDPATDGAALLFGKEGEAGGYTVTEGQDAIVAVKYAGSDEEVELTRGSNSFSIDGLNVTAKGKFGYGEDGKVSTDPDDAITFETNVSSDKMVSAISDMVKEYNEILELVNSQLSTRPDNDYFPLTDEQKKEMSESEIKLWEEKAKAGILFGSSELRGLSDDLRWAILPKDQQAMEAMGISVSSSWQDNGKLSFDETKFRAALEQDPDAVKEAFTRSDGIASNLKNTMEKYVKTMGATKGILIEKAGSTHAPTSVLSNSLKTEIDDVDKILENLKARLKSEQDRYISQFTQLETLISQMNSQSSYLSGLGF